MNIHLHQKQGDFFDSTAPIRGFVGGRGAGKSHIGCLDVGYKAHEDALRRGQPGLYAVYAPTYPLLRDTTMRSFREIWGPWITDDHKADGIIILRDGNEFIFRSLDDPERARGPNLSAAYMDEASLIDDTAYPIVLASLRQFGEQGRFTATFTPKGINHWTAETFTQEDKRVEMFHARSTDNPFLPEGFVDLLRSQYTTAYAEQEIEGLFVDLTGSLMMRIWFDIVDSYPNEGITQARHWDLAATEPKKGSDPDYTAGAHLVLKDGIIYIVDVQRDRLTPMNTEKMIKQTAQLDGVNVRVGLEEEGGASGKSLIDHYRRQVLVGFAVDGIRPTGDKMARAHPWASAAEAGNVKLVRGDWNKDFLDEVSQFPSGAHDDQIDAVSGAFHTLTGGFINPKLSFAETDEQQAANSSQEIASLLDEATDDERAEIETMMKEAGM